jgi:hypothetical protein
MLQLINVSQGSGLYMTTEINEMQTAENQEMEAMYVCEFRSKITLNWTWVSQILNIWSTTSVFS